MSGSLDGRRIMITAAAGHGIGHAIARRMAEEGARSLYLVDRDAERLPLVVDEISGLPTAPEVFSEVLDVSASRIGTRESVARAVETMGGLDVLVAHAGAVVTAPFLDTTDDELDRSVETNFSSTVSIVQEAARHMAAKGGGVILITASTVDSGGFPATPIYGATKAALINLAQAISSELASYNIRINTVSPGIVDSFQHVPGAKERFARIARDLPMGRLGQPDELAEVYAFLASDRASYVTGANFNVHGGLTAKSHGVKTNDLPWGISAQVTGRAPRAGAGG